MGKDALKSLNFSVMLLTSMHSVSDRGHKPATLHRKDLVVWLASSLATKADALGVS